MNRLLVTLLLCMAMYNSFPEGTRQIQARQRLKKSNKYVLSGKRSTEAISIRDVLNFQNNIDFEPVIARQTAQGNSVVKFKETVNGRNVYDAIVTVTVDKYGAGVDASGTFYEDIHEDELNRQGIMNFSQALKLATKASNHTDESIDRVSHQLDIYVDGDSQSHLAYFIDYFVVQDKIPSRPFTIIDSITGFIYLSLDILDTCKYSENSYGGNLKIGRIDYGNASECLNMRSEGNICFIENEFVHVIDMNSSVDDNITESAQFVCNDTFNDSVNGAFSPAFDALFYGTAVARMFKDWYHASPLRKDILLRVHYSSNFTNAFWDGRYCSFGDSNPMQYYPMVSLDIVGHEIGHAITEQFSNLLYIGESGGINEAFSDMTGEAAEFYLGQVDWMVGFTITRNEKALRYFQHPSKDNESINHLDEYYHGMDTHSSSGLYRHVFYLLINKYKISTRKAYQVFLHANAMYWHKLTTFVSGACDVLKAALDLGSWVNRFAMAFKQVGIIVCDVNDHIFWLRDGETYSGIFASIDTQPIFGFSVPPWASRITIKTVSNASISIILYYAGILTEEDYFVLTTGVNHLEHPVAAYNRNSDYFVQLGSEYDELTRDIILIVRYECNTEYVTNNILYYINYQRDCYK